MFNFSLNPNFCRKCRLKGLVKQALFFAGLLGWLWMGSPALAQEADFALRILHTNDNHSRLDPVEFEGVSYGGITRRKTLLDQIRLNSAAQDLPVLVLEAGDFFSGTPYFNVQKGEADLYFYNRLGYDALVIGNHDFDGGEAVLKEFVEHANFPVLAANVEIDPELPLSKLIKPWQVFERGGEQVGIFGLILEETKDLSSVSEGINFLNVTMSARQAVKELQEQGANKIIALNHLGFEEDKELARNVDGIDVIVGGHSHTPVSPIPGATELYPLVERSPNGQPVLVITDWEFGKYLGDLTVYFNGAGKVVGYAGKPHPVSMELPEDTELLAQLEKYRSEVEKVLGQVIGSTEVNLEGEREQVHSQETNLGDLVADAVLDRLRPSGAEIALLNGGGIRSSINVGDITAKEVFEVLPYENNLSQVDLTGVQIREALENGLSGVETLEGRFPHVAGLRFAWTPKAPVGSRVLSVEVEGPEGEYHPLNPDETYTVATTSFLLAGKDGYEVFREGRNPFTTAISIRDNTVAYIAAHSPIALDIDNRIVKGAEVVPTTAVSY